MADGLRTYQDSVALVTGAASGIGRAMAEALARLGAHVVLADLRPEPAQQVVADIQKNGGSADAEQVDVSDYAAVEELVQRVATDRGRLDYMFNNAGIVFAGQVQSYELDHWRKVLDVNLRGVIHGIQAAYPVMLEQGFGHIVNTASAAGLLATPGIVSYAASKHAVVGLSTSLRVEAAAGGVRVSVLCPGAVRTPIVKGGEFGGIDEKIPVDLLQESFEQLRPMDVDKFASRALRAVARNQSIIILPAWWRVLWWLNRLSPSLWLFLANRSYRDFAKRVAELEQSQDNNAKERAS